MFPQIHKPFLGYLLIILFALAQFAAVIHAEIHPFHEHSIECDHLDNAAEPRVSSGVIVFQFQQNFPKTFTDVSVEMPLLAFQQTWFLNRAPPTPP